MNNRWLNLENAIDNMDPVELVRAYHLFSQTPTHVTAQILGVKEANLAAMLAETKCLGAYTDTADVVQIIHIRAVAMLCAFHQLYVCEGEQLSRLIGCIQSEFRGVQVGCNGSTVPILRFLEETFEEWDDFHY